MSFQDLGKGLNPPATFGFTPYLFAETHFVRSQHPGTAIFALAALEPFRQIALAKDVLEQTKAQLIASAAAVAKTHYANCDGTLEFWGEIDYYLLFLSETETVQIMPDGFVTAKRGLTHSSTSSLSIK